MGHKVGWWHLSRHSKPTADDWWGEGNERNVEDFSPEADAVFQTQIPGHVDDLRVEGEWYAETSQ